MDDICLPLKMKPIEIRIPPFAFLTCTIIQQGKAIGGPVVAKAHFQLTAEWNKMLPVDAIGEGGDKTDMGGVHP